MPSQKSKCYACNQVSMNNNSGNNNNNQQQQQQRWVRNNTSSGTTTTLPNGKTINRTRNSTSPNKSSPNNKQAATITTTATTTTTPTASPRKSPVAAVTSAASSQTNKNNGEHLRGTAVADTIASRSNGCCSGGGGGGGRNCNQRNQQELKEEVGAESRQCCCCGGLCTCGSSCQCTEDLCSCEASGVLSSIDRIETSSRSATPVMRNGGPGTTGASALSTSNDRSNASSPAELSPYRRGQARNSPNGKGLGRKPIATADEASTTAAPATNGTAAAEPPEAATITKKAEFLIAGMTCTMCSQAIQNVISQLNGVERITISLATDIATVTWREPVEEAAAVSAVVQQQPQRAGEGETQQATADAKSIQDAIESVGYDVEQVRILRQQRQDSSSSSSSSDVTRTNVSNGQHHEQQLPDNNNGGGGGEESVEERWDRLRQRQLDKVAAKRRAFLWSLLGALPILLATMVLPQVLPRSVVRELTGYTVRLFKRDWQLEGLIIFGLATPVQFISGFEFYKMSYFGLRGGRAGMDVLVATGTTAAYGYALLGLWMQDAHAGHFFETSAVLIAMVLLGKWLQALAIRRTSDALSQLMRLQSKSAIKVTPLAAADDTASLSSGTTSSDKSSGKVSLSFNPLRDRYREEIVPIEQVQTGDIVKVIRGASIPADGRVVFGEIAVDESMISGESLPNLKTVGSIVLGGTVCVESSRISGDHHIASTTSSADNGGNDPAVASSTSGVGAAFVRVTGVGASTALAQIVQLVQEAQTRTVPIQSFADRISAVFVPAVCAISVVTTVAWYSLARARVVPRDWYEDLGEDAFTFSLLFGIACLVISCPCALGLATPTAVMVGTGVGAKQGVLIKGGEALEIAAKADAVVFDKTGTLTKGTPAVTDFCPIRDQEKQKQQQQEKSKSPLPDNHTDEDLNMLWLLTCLERNAEHPLAKAIVEYAEGKLDDAFLHKKPFVLPTNFAAMTGRGASGTVNGVEVAVGNRSFASILGLTPLSPLVELTMKRLEERGKTAMLAAIDGDIRLVLGVADQVKDEAAPCIAYLRDQMKVDVWMVTGDNRRTARAIANQINLDPDRVIAEALPAAKVQQVRRLQAQGHFVAMVGDGVNDSPALAQADVGMSMGTGAEIAAEASDMVLVRGRVTDVVTALHLSRTIFRRIQWNFVWALFYNCLGIPVAAGVLYPLVQIRLPPTLAAFAMALSSISVVLNSLSLRLYRAPSVQQAASPSSSSSIPSGRRRGRVQRQVPVEAPTGASVNGGNSRSDNDLTANLLANDHLVTTSDARTCCMEEGRN